MSELTIRAALVPHDLSQHSQRALTFVVRRVCPTTAIHVVHVIPPLSLADLNILGLKVGRPGLRRSSESRLRECVATMSSVATAPIHTHILHGDPGSTLATAARHWSVDLIVIPMRSQGGLHRWLLGSVTERVVRLAECNVLVLPNWVKQRHPEGERETAVDLKVCLQS